MKIIIPMAGRGSRFTDRGFEMPKPLIEVAGKPMLFWALESIKNIGRSEIIFILLEEHEARYGVSDMIKKHLPEKVAFVSIPDVTEGQLCTVLTAKNYINTEEDVLIAASDSYIKSDLEKHILQKPASCAGLISVADMPGDRWSFAKTNERGEVIEVAEKVRISNHASTGLYYFSNGSDLIAFGEEIIHKQEKTRGEYYVIPVYQKMINQGMNIGISVADEMWDMGTPEAKTFFERHLQFA